MVKASYGYQVEVWYPLRNVLSKKQRQVLKRVMLKKVRTGWLDEGQDNGIAFCAIMWDNGEIGIDSSPSVGFPRDSWLAYTTQGMKDRERLGVPAAALMEFFLLLFEKEPALDEKDYTGPVHQVYIDEDNNRPKQE